MERTVLKKANDVKFMLRYHQEDSKVSAWKKKSSFTGKAHFYTSPYNVCILKNSNI